MKSVFMMIPVLLFSFLSHAEIACIGKVAGNNAKLTITGADDFSTTNVELFISGDFPYAGTLQKLVRNQTASSPAIGGSLISQEKNKLDVAINFSFGKKSRGVESAVIGAWNGKKNLQGKFSCVVID